MCLLYISEKSIWPHCIREEEPSKTEKINPVLLAFDLPIKPTSSFQLLFFCLKYYCVYVLSSTLHPSVPIILDLDISVLASINMGTEGLVCTQVDLMIWIHKNHSDAASSTAYVISKNKSTAYVCLGLRWCTYIDLLVFFCV